MRTEEQQTKITQERKVGIIRFSRSQVTIAHGLICSFGSHLSYCGFEISNFKENKAETIGTWPDLNCSCVSDNRACQRRMAPHTGKHVRR